MFSSVARRVARPACARRALVSYPFSSSSPHAAATTIGEYTTTEQVGAVGVVMLNRPKALNALCDGLIEEVNASAAAFDADPSVGCIVITGSGEKAFAAGADIKEMASKSFIDVFAKNMFAQWADLTKIKTPTIAAVNGFALGGGCELAMMCDIMYASDRAKFGQPEITLGTIPGCGGTQRLTRAVGKARAMDLCLTGDMFDAEEALRSGLVARVFPHDKLMEETMKNAAKIAAFSKPACMMVKEAVNATYSMTLEEACNYERRLFHSSFATKDQKEGMAAFVEKRKAVFTDE
jgi:enoyl-CoA hydratase/carnithine racemase